MKILMLKGLPGSGKSTFAKTLVDQGWKRVNKDDLRAMIDNGKYTGGNENLVISVRDFIIVSALSKGKNVVVDDTNFHPKHEEQLLKLAAQHEVDFDVQMFDVPVEECIKRDLKRLNSVGEKVIREMYDQYLRPKQETYIPPKNARKAIMVDIDGTLAHMQGRSPYDYSKVGEDSSDEHVAELVSLLKLKGDYEIVIMSGRPEDCREDTENWLKEHSIGYHHLFMRPSDDKRKDFIVKKELFDKHVRNEFNVHFVLDDRNQVVDMWRSLGLSCYQVAPGNF